MSEKNASTNTSSWEILDRVQVISDMNRDIFEKITKNAETSKNLSTLLTLLEWEICIGLAWEKWKLIEDILSNPEIFENNPSSYQKLFEVLNIGISPEKCDTLKASIPKIYLQYKKWGALHQANKINTVKEEEKIEIEMKDTERRDNLIQVQNEYKNWEANRKDFIKEIPKAREVNEKIRTSLSPEMKWKLWNFIEQYRNSPIENFPWLDRLWKVIDQQKRLETFGKNNENYLVFLESYFYAQNEKLIQQSILDANKDNPKNQKEALKEFAWNMRELRTLNLPFPIEQEKSIGDTIGKYFPPTPATETAIAQAEKYEKTHTVYRDGTSLYFVNKENPQDTKKIEIFADRAVLTVSQNWLSLSRDMTLLSREEAAERRQERKREGENRAEKQKTQEVQNSFWDIRRKEYSLPEYSSVFLGDNRWDQAKYEELEIRLAQKSMNSREKLDTIREMQRLSQNMNQSTRGKRDTLQRPSDPMDTKSVEKFWKDKDALEKIVRMLTTREQKLNELIRQVESEKKTEKPKKTETNREDTYKEWETRARETLKTLTSPGYGYGELGQEYFDQMLQGLSRWSKDIWKSGKLELDDANKLKQQLEDLHHYSDVKRQEYAATWESSVAWQNIRNSISQDGSELNTIWKWQGRELSNWLEQKPTEKK